MLELFGDIIDGIVGDGIRKELEYQLLYRYLDRYVKYKNITDQIEKYNSFVKINKTIWICWFQGMENAPCLVKKCYESVQKNVSRDFDIIVITQKNLNEYIVLPKFIIDKVKKGIISLTHLSDIIRAELLYQYGGGWIDATVFCSRKVPAYMLSGELFFPQWSVMDRSILSGSSWWIYAQKDQKIIREVRNFLRIYWKNEDNVRNYYLFHIALSKIIKSDSANRSVVSQMVYFNNSVPHILYGMMTSKYNPKRWGIVNEQTPIHKLSRKKNYIQGDIYTYYMAFLEGKLV